MTEHELRKKAIVWLDVLKSLKGKYGSEASAELLTYVANATPQELKKDLSISEEETEKVIELTKSMIAFFRL